jgi:hypothetical protein
VTEPWRWGDHEQKARELEHFETPEWCVEAILRCEIMPHKYLYDPCCGRGIMGAVARRHGYETKENDIYDWHCANQGPLADFLDPLQQWGEMAGIIMNPPFSKATQFVKAAFNHNPRKILCFQRFAWWESAMRRDFWNEYPPNRIYVTESRATCWRVDISPEERSKMGNTPTAHAWYVWEPTHPRGTLVGRLEKPE